MKHADLINQMTLEEKASLCSGLDFWHTEPIERLGIPSIMLTDGPHGIRKRVEKKAKDEKYSLKGVPAICFPLACASACSWDPELLYEMGVALGEECLKERVSVLLGPGTNIKRSPLCGRNFEYFSEDPYLAGEVAAAFINGVQSKGVGTSLKHFAANNQETRRMTINTVADERTLREIYFPAFETAVKKAQPWTIMCSYNRINGTYAAENKWLLTDVLRGDFGYKGIVVTDWGAENERVDGLLAGQELEMPTSNGEGDKKIVKAVKDGKIAESFLDEMVDGMVELAKKAEKSLGDYTYDAEAHHKLARKIAGQSMVLLKNDKNILPLNKDLQVAVIGEMAKKPRYQGAGSSLVNPIKLDNAYDTMLEAGIKVTYSAGYSTNKKNKISDEEFIASAVETAKKNDVAVLFVGLTEDYEAEGFDRHHMDLPPLHNKLVEAVCAANEKTIVVLSCGAAVELPWVSKPSAILHSYLSGQTSGSATVDILFGDVNPSGKLAETYPIKLEDNSSHNYFPGTSVSVEYRESIFVGYRYYDKANKNVLFPFGFGLSYTTFEYSDIKLSKDNMDDTEELTVSFKVKNTGSVDGAEVAQVYVSDVESTIFKAPKELKDFKKVFLKAGEEKTVEVTLNKRSFAYYNVELGDWHVESGEYKILVGASSRDMKLEASVDVKSTVEATVPNYKETAPEYYNGDITKISDASFTAVLGHEIPPSQRDKNIPIDLCNNLSDAEDGKWGGRINRFLIKILGGKDSFAGSIALQVPIKNFISMSMGLFSPKMAEGLLLILNDKPKGLRKILAGIPKVIGGIGKLIKSI